MCAFFVATRWGHSACSRPGAHTGPECLHPPPTKRTPQARHRLCPIACPVAPAALMHMLFLRALHPIQHESHKGREGSVPPNSLCVLAPGALTPSIPVPKCWLLRMTVGTSLFSPARLLVLESPPTLRAPHVAPGRWLSSSPEAPPASCPDHLFTKEGSPHCIRPRSLGTATLLCLLLSQIMRVLEIHHPNRSP